MTEERKTPQTAADSDTLVSRTYRDAAAESAPEHLNSAVLQEAARAARPRYARLRAWTRPVAWAATVVLSVALVLEMAKTPTPDGAGFANDFGEFEVKAPEAEMPDESVLPETPPRRAASDAIEQRQRLDTRKIQADAPQSTTAESSADEFRLSDGDILQRAEDLARMQSENDRQAGPLSTSKNAMASDVAALGAAVPNLENSGCDESARSTPETWFECIAILEEAGRVDEAERQREMLQQEFPEFDTR